jgi:tetratricopeptide (TPR) repeat protein
MSDEVELAQAMGALITRDEPHLPALAERFAQAMALRGEGRDQDAAPVLHDILRADPRLAEPRLELAHIAAVAGDWEEAEGHARVALEILRNGGQWTDDVEPNVVLAFAANLLGEVLFRSVEDGDLFLSHHDAFLRRWNEAAGLFEEAAQLDPTQAEARANAARVRPLPV